MLKSIIKSLNAKLYHWQWQREYRAYTSRQKMEECDARRDLQVAEWDGAMWITCEGRPAIPLEDANAAPAMLNEARATLVACRMRRFAANFKRYQPA